MIKCNWPVFTHPVSPHYSQSLYLWIHLLANIYLERQQCQHSRDHLQTCTGAKELEFPDVRGPSWGLMSCKQGSLLPRFSQFCAFCWWFCCLKWPPGSVLKYRLVFLSVRRLRRSLWRKHLTGFVQAWVTVLFALSSVVTNQQNKLRCLSTNTKNEVMYRSVDENVVNDQRLPEV